jgi:hypothetical protein
MMAIPMPSTQTTSRLILIGLIAIAATILNSCEYRPDWDRLEADGNVLVRAIEDYHSAHGEYPPTLEAAGVHPKKTVWGHWEYKRWENRFTLRVGDYGRYGFLLYYDFPHKDWTRDT